MGAIITLQSLGCFNGGCEFRPDAWKALVALIVIFAGFAIHLSWSARRIDRMRDKDKD